MFESFDPDPPFADEHMQEALRNVKARVWRRRGVFALPSAVVVGAGYLLFTTVLATSSPVVATIETADNATVVADNSGLVDIDGPTEATGPAGQQSTTASSAGGVTSLHLDPDKVTVLNRAKPNAITDVEPESDITIEPTPEPAVQTLETADNDGSADAVTSSATPLEETPSASSSPDADTAASSSDETSIEPTSDLAQAPSSAGAPAPDDNGVATSSDSSDPAAGDPAAETTDVTSGVITDGVTDDAAPLTDTAAPLPDTAESTDAGVSDEAPTPSVSADNVAADNAVAGSAVGDQSDSDDAPVESSADLTEAPVVDAGSEPDAELAEGVSAVDTPGVDAADETATDAPAEAQSLDETAIDAPPAETPVAPADEDVVADLASGQTTDPAVAEPEPPVITIDAPVQVDFVSMVIDGFYVEIVLRVTDPDGWSASACGTSMNWGDGSSTAALCRPDCLEESPDGAVPPGIDAELRFSHVYSPADAVVSPSFKVSTGYECYGSALYSVLNPSLVLTPDGVTLPG